MLGNVKNCQCFRLYANSIQVGGWVCCENPHSRQFLHECFIAILLVKKPKLSMFYMQICKRLLYTPSFKDLQMNRGPILNKKMKNRKYLSVFRQKKAFHTICCTKSCHLYLHVNEYCITYLNVNLIQCYFMYSTCLNFIQYYDCFTVIP